ncbi:MAG: FG-GAP-like repeat-containing protein [Acidimicrobiales bacterium]
MSARIVLTRRAVTGLALSAALVAGITTFGTGDAEAAGPTKVWERGVGGAVRSSSPGMGDIDGDGRMDIVVGSHDGRVNVLRGSDGSPTPGWPQLTTHPIDSSPAIAHIADDGRPEIAIGVGTGDAAGGALYSFAPDGRVRFRYAAADRAFPSPSIYSTPAVGDINGDGRPDLSVGSLGLESVHAVDASGVRLGGFPFYWDDTIFSSAALVDVNGDGRRDIVIGGDSTPGAPVDHQGGMVRAIDGSGRPLWEHRVNDIVRGAPSVGDIDGDGRQDIVFGGGDFFGGSDSVKVWALELDGRVKPGWPQSTDGVTDASPTLADLTGNGILDVAIGTFDSRHGRGSGGSVYAWAGSGGRLPGYPLASGGGVVLGQISTGDFDGDGGQDLLVPTGGAIFAYSGKTGARLFSLGEGTGTGYQNTPLVADVDGNGRLDIVAAGFRGGAGVVTRYELDSTAEVGRLAWPQYRRNAVRNGTVDTLAEARSIDAACPPGKVPNSGFDDIAGSVHRTAVDCIAWWEITKGSGGGSYNPLGAVTRGQMASFIARLIEESGGSLPSNPPDAFSDDDGSLYEHDINRLADVGIVNGVSPGQYRPRDTVTRAQMATFLIRALNHRTGTARPFSRVNYFSDDNGHAHESNINKAAAAGLTGGGTGGRYLPNAPVRRDQMASFLARTLDVLVVEAGAQLPA